MNTIVKNLTRTILTCLFLGVLFWCARMGGESPGEGEIVIHLVGDVMLSRGVQRELSRNGYDYPYGEVAPLFKEDDLTVGNLECPITDRENSANKTKRFVFRADRENAAALKRAGFDCMNLANNHSMDYLSAGLGDTMDALADAGVWTVGAGKDAEDDASFLFEKDGYRIGMLAYNAFPTEGFFYDAGAPTVSYVSAYNLEDIKAEIERFDCDFKIVYFHWGEEYAPYPTETQKLFARAAADAGADLVVGTHPHVPGTNEVYNGVPVYYSLGNFVFDRQIQRLTDETVILRVVVNREGIKDIEEIPGRIRNARVELLRE